MRALDAWADIILGAEPDSNVVPIGAAKKGYEAPATPFDFSRVRRDAARMAGVVRPPSFGSEVAFGEGDVELLPRTMRRSSS